METAGKIDDAVIQIILDLNEAATAAKDALLVNKRDANSSLPGRA